MKEGGDSTGLRKVIEPVKNMMARFRLTPEFITRMRFALFMLAFLLLFLAFQVGDDWFVREFANYDWARAIGF
jgi:hypothetical protein